MLLLPVRLTARDANDALRMFEQGLKAHQDDEVVLDGSTLQQFDSSALAVLLECRRLCSAWGKRLVLRRVPPKLLELAGLYGIAGELPVQPDGAGTVPAAG